MIHQDPFHVEAMTNGLLPPGEGGPLNEISLIMSNSKDSGETLTLRCLFYREQVIVEVKTMRQSNLTQVLRPNQDNHTNHS